MDVSDDPAAASDQQPRVVVPLPSDHLPDELRDLNVYGMELSRPVHKLIMEHAQEKMGSLQGNFNNPMYGHLAWKDDSEGSLVGAIGCASEIILQAEGDSASALQLESASASTAAKQDGETTPLTIVSCGAFRFIVTEVVRSAPFPVVLVDELPDEEPGASSAMFASNTVDDEEEDDEYDNLEPPEMMKEMFQLLQAYVDQKVEDAANQERSPLEEAILQDSGSSDNMEQTRAEQMAATLIAFRTGILDIAPTPTEGCFALGFLAAEIVDLANPIRRKMLTLRDGSQRLRYVLRQVKDATGMAKARKMAQEITDKTDESSKDLKIGAPELPSWSRQIQKGTKVSYFWNEEYEWCDGEVIDDPVMVVDELLVTMRFDSDGEVHKLPFHPDEKARWRPV